MKAAAKVNLAASVRQRLLNIARDRRADFQLILIRYAVERLLYRLSQSPYKDRFLLKGAMLFSVWSDEPFRSTRDVDFLSQGESAVPTVKKTFAEICRTSVEDDGLEFLVDAIAGEEIRDDQEYRGVRLRFEARLAGARIPIQIDVGFGDAVTPPPEVIDYPVFLDLPAPRIQAYPREVVVAEKFQALVVLGIANSRMKDFFDLWILASVFDFEGLRLCRGIKATFERRETPLPSAPPLALTEEFYNNASKQVQWNAFLRKGRLKIEETDFRKVVLLLGNFLMPPTLALVKNRKPNSKWPAGGPWGE
jgi:predicted nucleotidyltransferase component of viral defense system